MEKFDLIVIGSGAGLDVATAAAEKGLKVAIIEKSKLGGTCLNGGGIPSKLLIYSANIMEIIKKAEIFGIKVKEYSIDFEKIINRVNNIVDTDANKIKERLKESKNHRLFLREYKFIEEKKIAVALKVGWKKHTAWDGTCSHWKIPPALRQIVEHLANRFRWRPPTRDLRLEKKLTGEWWEDLKP